MIPKPKDGESIGRGGMGRGKRQSTWIVICEKGKRKKISYPKNMRWKVATKKKHLFRGK